jgi:predicted ATP-grasp superfamily ATP-dependent carboligase
MKVLVFEWFSGGGLLVDRLPLDRHDSVIRQGRLMLETLSADFQSAGFETTSPVDYRVAEFVTVNKPVVVDHRDQLPKLLAKGASRCDKLVVIGPETDTRLQLVLEWATPWQDKLISPSAAFVELATSKFRTSQLLNECGIQNHCGILFDASTEQWPPPVELPAVFKPDDGAGSDGLIVVNDWRNVARPNRGLFHVEPFIDGVHLSLAALCGPNATVLLEPVHQHFDGTPVGHYIGGSFPVEHQLAITSKQLVRSALDVLPQTVGYVGFDLVLKKTCQERFLGGIVDVNPRLTSSYLGLRQMYETNLAEAMIKIASGEPTPMTLAKSQWEFRV